VATLVASTADASDDEHGNGVRRGDHRREEAFQDANLLDAAANAKAPITSQVVASMSAIPSREAS
jgi:hypothetical protein